MGCIGSRLGHLSGFVGASHSSSSDAHYHNSAANGGDGVHHNVFPVLNVDDMGRHISPGKLEVTETELILYIHSKTPLNWPLRCLRRYGYENDLFSFESGRRCPTGPGIYAFKCTRAQSLFNLLQAKIQNNPSSNIQLPPPQLPISPTNPDGTGGDGGDDSSSTTPGSISPTFDYVNIAENSQLLRGNMNANAAGTSDSAEITISSNGIMVETEGDNNHPVYMNVENKSQSKDKDSRKVRSDRICNGITPFSSVYQNDYLNYHSAAKALAGAQYQSDSNSSVLYTNVACSDPTPAPARQEAPAPTAELNYAELDLKQIPSSKSLFTRSSCANGNSQQNVVSNNNNTKLNISTDIQKPSVQSKNKAANVGAASSSHSSNSTNNSSTAAPISANLSTLSYAILQPPKNTSPNVLNAVSQHQPTPSELGYATIDFDRTAALSIVTRSKIKLNFSHSSSTDKDDDEDGANTAAASSSNARKTRHNSTAL